MRSPVTFNALAPPPIDLIGHEKDCPLHLAWEPRIPWWTCQLARTPWRVHLDLGPILLSWPRRIQPRTPKVQPVEAWPNPPE